MHLFNFQCFPYLTPWVTGGAVLYRLVLQVIGQLFLYVRTWDRQNKICSFSLANAICFAEFYGYDQVYSELKQDLLLQQGWPRLRCSLQWSSWKISLTQSDGRLIFILEVPFSKVGRNTGCPGWSLFLLWKCQDITANLFHFTMQLFLTLDAIQVATCVSFSVELINKKVISTNMNSGRILYMMRNTTIKQESVGLHVITTILIQLWS